ncbi:MAG: uracil permease [Firmicutes bacterium]|nr:uracil permease [Bacillota bacterium]
MGTRRILMPEEHPPLVQALPLSLQHMFAMFGATVLVPYLVGLDPSIALLASGVGTLIYIVSTRFQVPSYLGSSFAFIAPLIAASKAYGLPAALGGGVAAGLVYVLVALLVSRLGSEWIHTLMPPAFVGAIVIVIGLGLAPTAIDMAMKNARGATDPGAMLVAAVTLGVALAVSVFGRGFLSVVPVLTGVIVGYAFAAARGMVDWAPVRSAAWIGLPHFTTPAFSLPAVALVAPVALVTLAEHIGHLFVANSIVGRDFFRRPGLHRSLLGDGLATMVASFLGGPPSTTYGENLGVMAITRVYSVSVIGGAGLLAALLAFVPKLGAAIHAIPQPVMGGVSILLFGTIAASGLRMLVDGRVDYSNQKNLMLSSVTLVVGLGGTAVDLGRFHLEGMALATGVGILLNLAFLAVERLRGREEEVGREAVTGPAEALPLGGGLRRS